MLSNSIAGGALVAAYLLVLMLQINPALPLESSRLGPLALTIVLFYGIHATVVFYALIVLRQLVATEIISPGWISFRLGVWMAAAASVGVSIVMWLNLRGFASVLEPHAVSRMATGATALTACAAVFVLLALYDLSSRRRNFLSVAVFVVAIAASITFPITARGRGRAPESESLRAEQRSMPASTLASSHIIMLLVDGASLDLISPAAAEGRLPNFGRILDAGAVMHLATLRPTQPETVWAAVATGKLPYRNGIRSAATYGVARDTARVELLPDYCFAHGLVHFDLLTEEWHGSQDLRSATLWQILSSVGVASGIVNWPLTHPVVPVRGYLVSDAFARQADTSFDADSTLVYPASALGAARLAFARQRRLDRTDALLPASAAAPESIPSSTDAPQHVDAALEQVAADLQRTRPVQLTALRYQELDAAGHYFMRYAVPRAFGDVSEAERRQYGRVLEQNYAFVDAAVGRAIAALGPSDLLLVISPFGMEPMGIGKRLLERMIGDRLLSGSHEGAPDGFLLAYGSAVPAAHLTRASVLDVTPTVLYYLGLPVARDMDGYARTDIFSGEFTADHPITFIPSYE